MLLKVRVGVATVDKKHQIVIDAQAFGEGQVNCRLMQRLGISENIFDEGTIVTAEVAGTVAIILYGS